jgi:hypothetical protein
MKDKKITEYTRLNNVDVDSFKFGWDIYYERRYQGW